MSVDSPVTIIPFERFLECRERRRLAAATSPAVMPASTDPDPQADATGRASADQVGSRSSQESKS